MRTLLGLASPAGARGRLSVLVLHRVVLAEDPLFLETMVAERFDELCRWLKSLFNVLPLDEAAQRLRSDTLPPRALAITFDDGYADNCTVAMPILVRHGLPATFFVATGFVGNGLMWNDAIIESLRASRLQEFDAADLIPALGRPLPMHDALQRRRACEALIAQVKYLEPGPRQLLVDRIVERAGARAPAGLMMSEQQIVEMRRAGMQIGAHTVTHPILASLPLDEARREMQHSQRWLQDLLGERVGLFAYPNGKPGEDYDERSVMLAREIGFDAAVTTVRGAATRRSDPFQLPRFTPWDRTRLRFGARMLATLCTPARREAELLAPAGGTGLQRTRA
jgi:peptidoglycan/xylan/chitin deacetylase (PgdA/CDA1 family)